MNLRSNNNTLPFYVSVLIFVKNKNGEFLLLRRNKSPNKDCWTPIGGKLHMDIGESPFECAVRELEEESGLKITNKALHLFAMISEKGYEGQNHWLLFLFNCLSPIEKLPEPIEEGYFKFFSRHEIDNLSLPETDREGLWNIYDKYHKSFIVLKANCYPETKLQIIVEECH